MKEIHYTPKDLGEGIFEYKKGESFPTGSKKKGLVFLDRLLLPCKVSELSEPQIVVTNKYRERYLSSTESWKVAEASRALFRQLIFANEVQTVLEVGPGKFPVLKKEDVSNYVILDIDDDAIIFCKNAGIKSLQASEFEKNASSEMEGCFELVFGSFSFHFNMED